MSLPTPPDGAFPPPPPTLSAYGSPEFMGPVRPIATTARLLTGALVLMVPIQVLSLIDSWELVGSARDYLAGVISQDQFEAANSGGALGGLHASITMIVTLSVAVLTFVWMQTMARNVRVLGRTGLTWGPGWAIGGWFVPPGLLYVVPWLMFRELWRASAPGAAASGTGWRAERVPHLIDVWWVLYGLVPILGLVTSFGAIADLAGSDNYRTIAENLDRFATLNLAVAGVGIVTTGVYFVMVRSLSARHMQCTGEA